MDYEVGQVWFTVRSKNLYPLLLTDIQLKILHVISNLNPRSGGPTTVVKALSEYQTRAQMDVTVCTTSMLTIKVDKTRLNNNFFENGVRYRYFSSTSPLLLSHTMNKWLKRRIKFFDIVHIHGLYRFPVTCAAWRSRKAGVPYLIRLHGCMDPFLYNQSQYNITLKRIYERFFDVPNLNHASAIHYTTEDEKKRAAFLRLRSRPVVISNGIDWERYRNLPPKGNFYRYLGIDCKTPLVLFLGRINFKKGLDLLVPAFARVAETFPNARLAVVGPDSDGYGAEVRQWCRDQGIQEKVLFSDYLEPEKVKEAYVDADVFVLPSYTENFGMTVVEAMASGCPVVISDQVNIWREVKESGAGIAVSLDPRSIAEAICRLLADKRGAKKMGTYGRFMAEKYYAWPRIVKQLTHVYRQLIDERRSVNRH